MFSCEIGAILKNTYCVEHLRAAASFRALVTPRRIYLELLLHHAAHIWSPGS